MKLEHGWHSVHYNETISYNYEMKLSRYNNEAISYNYEKKSIRYHIFMKEFIFLLKNEILPLSVTRDYLYLVKYKFFPRKK